MWNAVGDQLVAGGGRRLALMLCLNFDHPDIEEFIDSKLNLGKLNNANISIVIPADYDASDFVKAVEDGAEIPLRFNGRPDHEGRTINARLLWDRIVDNASTSGEPGVLNAHLANKESNVWYSHPLISTNPCGEQWLPGYGCCDLGAIVLPRHVRNGRVDWGSLRQTIDIGVRFLDNILTVNDYPLPEMQQMAQDERRIGLGVMGLHSMMLDCGVQYGTREGLNFIDSLFRFIKEEAYVSSTDLAGEKGAFPLYDPALLESGFMQRMEPEVRSLIETKGLRNCCLLTVAPTGTTAIVQNVTSGIEPMFSPVYYRRRFVPMKNGKKRIHRTLVISKDYTDHLFLAEGAYDIPPESHFEVQKLVQSHVDSAVSKTINIPKAFPKDKLAALWLRYLPSVKGTTLYREGSRAEEPLEYIPTKDLPKILSNWTGDIENEDGSKSIDPCVWGVCDV
jgi:ribonucleoside-diphosphate reductase alpha chain